MKNFIYIIIALLTFSSCENMLEEEVYDTRTVEDIYATPESANAVVLGVLKSFGSYNYYSAQLHQVLGFHSGLTGRRAGANSAKPLAQMKVTPGTAWIDKTYDGMYETIASANFVISTTDSVPETDIAKNARGVALFSRAVSYFNLVRMYGGTPLVLEPILSEEESHVPRATKEAVFQQIEKDLIEAWGFLYEAQEVSAMPSKWAAKAFLAKLYLRIASETNAVEDWTKARDYAVEVITSTKYSLVPNFDDLFDLSKEFSSESIFELAFATVPDGGCAFPNIKGPHKTTEGASLEAWGRIIVLRAPYDRMLAAVGGVEDARMNLGALTTWNRYGGTTAITYPIKKGTKINDKATSYLFYPGINKWNDPGSLNRNTAGNNFIVCRLAEMYLIAAEAENEINPLSQTAIDYLNDIRERSRNSGNTGLPADYTAADFTSKEDLTDAIMDERLVEFVGELHTWFDARRRGVDYLTKIFNAHNDNLDYIKSPEGQSIYGSGIFKSANDFYFPTDASSVERNLLLPIPATVIQSNNAIGIEDQNPGY
ncbi:RagB/SusD family nutrient uptake outer membrane protein [Carboxylicivirga marina]|uniref:RagB/SusD family nutrient uptake outer membrane protein n=1 Tax=Carboxylicivirga marina TaxID=2800988 RepID=A0ABS1HKM8_9BACT|nr:RagB/SusD family nutrient uptake outer membrane protein [Carboxylicivirga marina]MBK3518228.1 RagB/SusD family nutrient uptake outer membrane protein [Carboxylicivirga marina]